MSGRHAGRSGRHGAKSERRGGAYRRPAASAPSDTERERVHAELQEAARQAGPRTQLAISSASIWGSLGVGFMAARAARRVIPHVATHPLLGVWVGQMLARYGGREEACAVYCDCEGLPRGHVDAYATLGLYLLSVGLRARGVEFLGEAKELFPEDPELERAYREAVGVRSRSPQSRA